MKLSALVLTLCGVAAVASPVSAGQAPTDSRWQPYLGCWQLVEERSLNENVATRACFAPSASADAVLLMTHLSDGSAAERLLVADGRQRSVELADCRGTEISEWSSAGHRLFRRGELRCGADAQPRRVSAISFLANATTWLDIEVVGDDVQVRRFFREGDRVPGATGAARPFTIDDVQEATGKVTALAIEAAIVESHARFRLDGKTLLALDAAGVADNVIDLMVAVSYPRHFIVDRPGVPPGRISGGSGGGGSVFFGPGFGYSSSAEYQFSPNDLYGFWSYFGAHGYFLDPSQYSTGSSPAAPGEAGGSAGSGRAVAVNGLGYTRVREAGDASVARGPNSTAVSGPRSVATSGSGDISSSSSGSGDSGVSSSGGYSGGGGGDSGRTAVPR